MSSVLEETDARIKRNQIDDQQRYWNVVKSLASGKDISEETASWILGFRSFSRETIEKDIAICEQRILLKKRVDGWKQTGDSQILKHEKTIQELDKQLSKVESKMLGQIDIEQGEINRLRLVDKEAREAEKSLFDECPDEILLSRLNELKTERQTLSEQLEAQNGEVIRHRHGRSVKGALEAAEKLVHETEMKIRHIDNQLNSIRQEMIDW